MLRIMEYPIAAQSSPCTELKSLAVVVQNAAGQSRDGTDGSLTGDESSQRGRPFIHDPGHSNLFTDHQPSACSNPPPHFPLQRFIPRSGLNGSRSALPSGANHRRSYTARLSSSYLPPMPRKTTHETSRTLREPGKNRQASLARPYGLGIASFKKLPNLRDRN